MNQPITKTYERYVSTHFHKSGRKQKNFLDTQKRFFQENYLRFLPKDKGVKIIDLGCGLGNFLHFLRSAGYQNISGVDASRECADFCKKNELDVAVSAIIPYLESLSEPVDVFTMNDVLEHMTKEDMWRALELIRHNLTEDGICIIKVPNMSQPLLGLDSRYIDITHEIGFTASSLEQVLRMTNFGGIKIFGPNIYVFNGPKNFLARVVAGFLNAAFRILFTLYGRTETRIFTKHLVAVSTKKAD